VGAWYIFFSSNSASVPYESHYSTLSFLVLIFRNCFRKMYLEASYFGIEKAENCCGLIPAMPIFIPNVHLTIPLGVLLPEFCIIVWAFWVVKYKSVDTVYWSVAESVEFS